VEFLAEDAIHRLDLATFQPRKRCPEFGLRRRSHPEIELADDLQLAIEDPQHVGQVDLSDLPEDVLLQIDIDER
jgi:hypothetical protein